MRRALSTTLIAYPTLRKRLEEQGKPIVILPQLQEVNNLPCDTGFPRERLEANPEYTGLDFSHLTPDWTSKQGFYGYDVPTLQARARWNRRWLRERPEKEIVVVAHGDCLRYITEGYNSHAPWENVEVREYTFVVDEEDDVDGEAVLTRVKKVVQDSSQGQPSSSSDRFQGKY
ncbi:putative phosphatase SPAC5H10.03 [Grifola frondosa]|uniref:Putative phosphatase SPAC5H10.03 n=1 Tax=Grifola frondosa TaxID=5627 RepID=A0A1C7LP66_GRIFR|nr:putative phosphatase SPAC5H10.03 [Grifola frondosa]